MKPFANEPILELRRAAARSVLLDALAELDGRLPLDLLVTERIGLDALDAAFDAMRRGDGARRVVRF